jgi:hypothetical protein
MILKKMTTLLLAWGHGWVAPTDVWFVSAPRYVLHYVICNVTTTRRMILGWAALSGFTILYKHLLRRTNQLHSLGRILVGATHVCLVHLFYLDFSRSIEFAML